MPSDVRKAFTTHTNYLAAFGYALDRTYTSNRMQNGVWLGISRDRLDVYDGIATTFKAQMKAAQAKTGLNVSGIEAVLRNAWTTEVLMATTGKVIPAEGRGASNNWTVVQACYAIFNATRALAIASGKPEQISHAACQRFFYDWWCTRAFRPAPWSLAYVHYGPDNSPTGKPANNVSNLSTCGAHTYLSFAQMALKTTHDQEVDEALRVLRLNNLKKAQKAFEATQVAREAKRLGPYR